MVKGTGTAERRRLLPRAARVCAAVFTAVVLAGAPATAHSGASDDIPTREEIYGLLGLRNQVADYTILVDTSASMAEDGKYDTVRATLRPFLDTVSAKDHITLVTFDERPQLRYDGTAGGPANTDRILAQLPTAPTPDAGTDVGAALEAALAGLDRADVASLASVVLVTDGRHEPPAGSDYPDSTGPSWDTLRTRAEDLGRRTDLAGYALPLGSESDGAELLGSVVRPTSVLRPAGVDDLSRYLQRAGDRTRARKAALVLAPDLGKGVTASWSGDGRLPMTGGEARTRLTLSSRSRHVPLTVTGLSATLAHPHATVSGLPAEVRLEPGKSETFDVTVRGHVAADLLPVRRTKHADADLRVSGRVTSPWQSGLRPDIDLRIPADVAADGQVPLTAAVGHPQTLPVTVVVLVLLPLIGWALWLRTHRPRLHGELVLWPVLNGQSADRIALRGRRMTVQPRHVGGRGRIRGRRRATDAGAQVDLLIHYTPDGSAGRETDAVCPPGGQVVINGISFSYVPRAGGPARSPR